MSLRRLLSVLIVLLLAAFLAACSDSGEGNPDTEADDTEEPADEPAADAGDDGDGGDEAEEDDEEADDGSAVDPCSLLTQAEVTEALGAEVGEPTDTADAAECGFPPLEGDTGIVVTVQVYPADQVADAFAEAKANQIEFAAAEIMTGLGDDAFFTPGFGSVDVLVRDVWFTIGRDGEYEIGADDETRQIVVELAVKALARVA